jgi:hypothetical protein
MKLQLETYKAEQTRLKRENGMYEGMVQNLRDEIVEMRNKMEQERLKKEGEEGMRDTYYRKKEIRGLRMSQIGDPDNSEDNELPEEIEKKIIEVLLKEVMPTLSEIEGAALKRFVN